MATDHTAKFQLFIDNLKDTDSKSLHSQKKVVEKSLKKLQKDPIRYQKDIKKTKIILKGVENKLQGRVQLKSQVGTFHVKKSYLKRLKDPAKYYNGLKRRKSERIIALATDKALTSGKSADFRALQGITHRYQRNFEGDEKYNGGMVNAVNLQLKEESNRYPSLFVKTEMKKSTTENLLTMDIESESMQEIEFSS